MGESTAKAQPSASIVIEFAPLPLLSPTPGKSMPEWNWEAELAAAEWGRAAAEWGRAARQKLPLVAWKSQVAWLHEHKRYPFDEWVAADEALADERGCNDQDQMDVEAEIMRIPAACGSRLWWRLHTVINRSAQ